MKKFDENLKSEMSVERIISQQFEADDQSLSILNENYSDTSMGETISFSPLSYFLRTATLVVSLPNCSSKRCLQYF